MAKWLKRMMLRLKRMATSGVPVAKHLWTLANSPLVITLVSGLFIAGIARWYSHQDEAAKDFAARSDRLEAALTELQQRVAYLQSADHGWKERCGYVAASGAEWDAITGSGEYVPTSPSFRGTSIMVVLNEAQRSSGAWDPQFDADRWFGFLSVKPPRTALFVRGQLPWLDRYVSARLFALSLGHLPLRQGTDLSPEMSKELGIPTLDDLHRDTMKRSKKLDELLSKPGPNLPPCKE